MVDLPFLNRNNCVLNVSDSPRCTARVRSKQALERRRPENRSREMSAGSARDWAVSVAETSGHMLGALGKFVKVVSGLIP